MHFLRTSVMYLYFIFSGYSELNNQNAQYFFPEWLEWKKKNIHF
jgi:hypothetical protein